MTAPHFFAPSIVEDVVVLSGEDARHAIRALRLHPGEAITVSDGAGHVAEARVLKAGSTLDAEVLSRRFVPAPRPRLTVFQALAKGGKLELVVQKLTELGVSEVVPFVAQRSIPKWDRQTRSARVERLRNIAREAAMQCRRAWLPQVGEVATLDDVPRGALLLHEEATDRLGDALPAGEPVEITLVVGPEGGLDPEEVRRLRDAGVRPVALGPLILRTETAALVAASIALFRYGCLG